MNITAVIPTRGDHDLQPIFESLPEEWEIIVWVNGDGVRRPWRYPAGSFPCIADAPNVGPHGRFAAIEYAAGDLIFVQDDDVIISDPQAIVDGLLVEDQSWSYSNGVRVSGTGGLLMRVDHVVCNMPPQFRPNYQDSALVGFGAAFHRDLPEKAFQRFFDHHTSMTRDDPLFLRESCRVFTTLTPRILVDIEKTDLPYASDEDRLWRQPGHVSSRDHILSLTREVRDSI